MNVITTDHEKSLLELMATGHTDSAIAKRLNIGKRTLERRLASLMARVGAPSRLALGAIAAQRRWIDIDYLLKSQAAKAAKAARGESAKAAAACLGRRSWHRVRVAGMSGEAN